MIIDNAKGMVLRHNSTGRPLNMFNKVYSDKAPTAKIQKTMDDLFFGKLNISMSRAEQYFEASFKIASQYKLDNKNYSNKRIKLFRKILMWCFCNVGETLAIKIIPSLVTRDVLKFVILDLEKLDLIEVYDGFKGKKEGESFYTVPRAIRPTKNLLEIRNRL